MDTPPDLNYTCPVCGRPAQAGKHFCKVRSGPEIIPFKTLRHRPRKPVGPLVFGVAGVLLVIILLWSWLGSWSLPVAAAGLLAVWFLDRHKASGGRAFAELVKLCGSRETASRLVAAEQNRAPGSSRKTAAGAALDRLRHDRSR